MNNTIDRQSGMTFVGGILLGGVLLGYFVFGLAALPLVTEYFGVRTIMKNMAELPPEALPTPSKIRAGFVRRANINGLVNFEEIALEENKDRLVVHVDRKTKKKTIFVRYESKKKLMGVFHVAVLVHQSIELGSGQTQVVALPYDEESR